MVQRLWSSWYVRRSEIPVHICLAMGGPHYLRSLPHFLLFPHFYQLLITTILTQRAVDLISLSLAQIVAISVSSRPLRKSSSLKGGICGRSAALSSIDALDGRGLSKSVSKLSQWENEGVDGNRNQASETRRGCSINMFTFFIYLLRDSVESHSGAQMIQLRKENFNFQWRRVGRRRVRTLMNSDEETQ